MKIPGTWLRTFPAKERAGTDLRGHKEVSASREELVTPVPGKGSAGRGVEAGPEAADAFEDHRHFPAPTAGPRTIQRAVVQTEMVSERFFTNEPFFPGRKIPQSISTSHLPTGREGKRSNIDIV